MRILINTASTHKGGGLQVASSFINECKQIGVNEYFIVLSPNLASLIAIDEYPDNFHFYTLTYRPATRIFSLKNPAKDLKRIENETNPDVVFTTTGPAYWRPKAKHVIGFNLGHHIYTDSPFFKKISLYKKIRWFLRRKLVKYYYQRDADAIVGQTYDVTHRAASWLGIDECYTVSNTCSKYYDFTSEYSLKLPKKNDGDFRFLTLSSFYEHKNLEIINEIVEELTLRGVTNVKFILTLPEDEFAENFDEELSEWIWNVGPVSLEDGPGMYSEVDAMFLPTLIECFSASYPEAMAMEKPIITTDLGFARSICGSAALYYEPLNAAKAAIEIEALLMDPLKQEELVESGKTELLKFDNPEERARKYLRICQQLVDINK